MFCGIVSTCVIYLLALAPAIMISTRESRRLLPPRRLFSLYIAVLWQLDFFPSPGSSTVTWWARSAALIRLGACWRRAKGGEIVGRGVDLGWGNACLTLPVRAEHRELISRPVSDHLTGSYTCSHATRGRDVIPCWAEEPCWTLVSI